MREAASPTHFGRFKLLRARGPFNTPPPLRHQAPATGSNRRKIRFFLCTLYNWILFDQTSGSFLFIYLDYSSSGNFLTPRLGLFGQFFPPVIPLPPQHFLEGRIASLIAPPILVSTYYFPEVGRVFAVVVGQTEEVRHSETQWVSLHLFCFFNLFY